MSEVCTASVDGYAESARDEVAQRAGLAGFVGGAVLAGAAALAMAGAQTVAAALAALREEVRSRAVELERAAAGSTEPRLAECVARAYAMLSALERPEFGLLHAAARKQGLAPLQSLRRELRDLESEARTPGANLRSVSARAEKQLAKMEGTVTRGVAPVLQAEASVLHDAVAGTLQALGYRVAPPKRPQHARIVLRGVGDHGRAIYVTIDPRRGHLSADMAGFESTTCETERGRFLSGLAARGVKVRLLVRHLHAERDGGQLVRQLENRFATEPSDEEERQRQAAAYRYLHDGQVGS